MVIDQLHWREFFTGEWGVGRLILEEDDLTGQWRLEMSGDVDSFQPHLTKL